MKGHTDVITGIIFNRKDNRIITASKVNKIRLGLIYNKLRHKLGIKTFRKLCKIINLI